MPLEIFGEKYAFLGRKDILSFEEIERLVRLFVNLGVEKIRITGGEPLVRKDIEKLIGNIRSISDKLDIALTTNGYLLFEKALALKNAGLSRLTVSLDSVDKDTYIKMNGGKYGPSRTLQGIEEAERVGFSNIKINVVVQKGLNDHNFVDVAEFYRDSKKIVRFIEFMDVGNKNNWKLKDVISSSKILEIINKKFPVEPIDKQYNGEVANRYRYIDGKGEIGIISSISQPFCGDCTRGRLSTDGKFITCLFASDGIDLKKPLRSNASDEHLISQIKSVWSSRNDKYSQDRFNFPKDADAQKNKVEMYYIGG
tara:strand:- start:4633 stop:5565 length:933 start_codon:yes stop_codon:yes gene_type:complete